MSEDIEKAFKGQAPGYSKHVGYTRYVNGKAIRVEGGAQPHQKVTLAAPGSVKHKGGEFLDRLHSYVHKKAPTTEHELQEAVHRFVHSKFEGDEKSLQKFHAEGLKELSKHGLVTHHEPKAAKAGFKPAAAVTPKAEKEAAPKGNFSPAMLEKLRDSFSGIERVDPESKAYKGVLKLLDTLNPKQLQTIVDAKIKFVSKLARNRLPAEKDVPKTESQEDIKRDKAEARKLGMSLTQYYGHKHTTWLREQEKKPRKEAPHPADQELAERKKETQADRNAKWVKDNEDKTGLRPKLAGWQYHEGNKIQAPLSSKGDYVISHWREREGKERHNVSYRPTGKHEHVGEYPSAKEAAAAADAHNKSPKKQTNKDEPPKRLDREIAARKTDKPKAAEPLSDTRRSAESLPKVPSFEEATHKRLSVLAKHPSAKKRAIAKLAERIASKPEGVSHRDLANEVNDLEWRHGEEPTTTPEEIGYHEPAVQRILEKFSSSKTLLDAMVGRLAEPHVKANAYEAARRLNEGQKATPAPAQPAAKPAPKAEEKPAATPAALQKIGKFDEGSVRYLVDHMSESELRSRLPQASDSIKNNVNEALRRIAEKKEEKTS